MARILPTGMDWYTHGSDSNEITIFVEKKCKYKIVNVAFLGARDKRMSKVKK
jgi:hypothetical protein